jgi:hypothetical protein
MNETTAVILELAALYVLSAVATFWFIWDWQKKRGNGFVVSLALFFSLLWPLFFVYQVIREFSK